MLKSKQRRQTTCRSQTLDAQALLSDSVQSTRPSFKYAIAAVILVSFKARRGGFARSLYEVTFMK